MVAKNDITGDAIQTKVASQSYSDNYDRIFGKKSKPRWQPPSTNQEQDIDPENPDKDD